MNQKKAKALRKSIGGRRALSVGASYIHENKKLKGFLLPPELRGLGANERMVRLLVAGGAWAEQLKPKLTAVFSVQRKLVPGSARDRYQRAKRGVVSR